MAKLKVVGKALVLESRYTLGELQLIESHKPEILALKDKDNNDVFVIKCARNPESKGSISKYGVEFTSTFAKDAKATVTVLEDFPETEDVKDYLADKYGVMLSNVNQIEENATGACEEIKANLERIKEAIQIS
jgi:hypothetical protein